MLRKIRFGGNQIFETTAKTEYLARLRTVMMMNTSLEPDNKIL